MVSTEMQVKFFLFPVVDAQPVPAADQVVLPPGQQVLTNMLERIRGNRQGKADRQVKYFACKLN